LAQAEVWIPFCRVEFRKPINYRAQVVTNMASPMPASLNQIAGWLKQIDTLRQAA